MAHGGDFGLRMRCTYKSATALVCAGNVIAALYVLHGMLGPFHTEIPVRSRMPMHNGTVMPYVMRYTMEESERIRRAHQIRKAMEPLDLIKRVKEMQEESLTLAARVREAEIAKQKVAADLAQRLRELRGRANQGNAAEAIDEWRKKKLDEVHKRTQLAQSKEDTDADSRKAAQEEEVVAKTLELGWGPLLEAAGLSVTEPNVSSQKLQGGKLILKGPEIEDGIIPGRPVPPHCHAEPHTDYDGVAVAWGLTHHQESAADCCQACLNQARTAKAGDLKCNVWVYCPSEEGCFSPDIYEHKQFECWLKQADLPKVNFKGKYSSDYQRAHPNSPAVVPWVSGVI